LAEGTKEHNDSFIAQLSFAGCFCAEYPQRSWLHSELAAVGFTRAESNLLAQLCKPEAFQRFLSPLRSFATFAVKALDFQFPLFGNLPDFANPVLLRVSVPPW
jgi:hypothetical protein